MRGKALSHQRPETAQQDKVPLLSAVKRRDRLRLQSAGETWAFQVERHQRMASHENQEILKIDAHFFGACSSATRSSTVSVSWQQLGRNVQGMNRDGCGRSSNCDFTRMQMLDIFLLLCGGLQRHDQ